MKKILLLGSVPSKKNSKTMVCRGKFPMLLPSQRYTKWHKQASKQLVGIEPINAKKLIIIFFAGDNHKFDLTNKAESIMDLLVDMKLIEDDNYSVIEELCLKFGGVDKGRARCLIEY